jgi:hypothetical protein
MRAFGLGCVALLASTSFAFADDVMANFYGNTIIAKTDMSEVRMHYRADHTFDGTGSSMIGSMGLKGIWKLDNQGQLCRTYDTPPPGVTNPLCTPWTAHKVGDTWTLGNRTITLVPGIQ